MSRRKISVLYACTAYEGSKLVRVFASEKAAVVLRDKCKAYAEKRPVAADDATVTEIDIWWKKQQRWERNHPAGPDFFYYDNFQVINEPYTP